MFFLTRLLILLVMVHTIQTANGLEDLEARVQQIEADQ